MLSAWSAADPGPAGPLLVCPDCGAALPGDLAAPPGTCPGCARAVRRTAGVWDLLRATADVEAEYARQITESGFGGGVADFQVVVVAALESHQTEARLLRALSLPEQNVRDDLTWHNYLGVREHVVRPGTTLVELGCRSPSFFLRDAARHGVRCLGVDLYFHTDGASDSGYTKVLADMCHLPFADRTVDTVLVSSALHHVRDLPRAVREVHRVLRPGGRFVVASEPAVSVLRGAGLLAPRAGDKARYTYAQYLDALRQAGFGRPRVHFPHHLDRLLASGSARRSRRPWLGACLTSLWRLPAGRAAIRAAGLWPGLTFLDLPLVAVAVR
jgi:SAM-dependent methyltransferase